MEHAPQAGLSGLPVDVKNTVLNVIYFYQYVAVVSILDICDNEIMTHYFGRRVVVIWQALSPFIEVERAKRGGGSVASTCLRNLPFGARM
jgi:hypothetical protein